MKKGVILFIVVLVIVLITTAFAIANSNEDIVKDLICQRTDTLGLYYAGKINKKEAMTKISSITTDFLKEEDLANLEKYFQCDLEQLVDYKITEINVNYSDDEVICAMVNIDWKANGLKGEDNFSHTYSVICKKEEKMYKLAQFF